ncbi:MAG: insulinase family protein [Gemmatimonadetes bacterium]|nr:insulinase family protein [Gemmatimonadota bacterium]
MRISWSIALAAATAITVAVPLAGQEPPDRSRPPQLGPTPELKLPPIQRFTLSNGLAVVLLEKHQVPLVQVNVMVQAGAVMDPPAKSGLAAMTAAMLDEGAGKRNALELADAIEFLGATLSAGAGQHTSLIALHTPLSKLDSAIGLLADVTLRPTFAAEELERQRKERLTTFTQWRDRPSSIASVIFSRTLYGTSHPYGAQAVGDPSSVAALTVADLRDFHQARFHPGNATLIVVGDVTTAGIRPKLEAAFGQWLGAATGKPSLPEPKQVATRQVFLVDKPGAAQSEIRIGRIGVPRLTEDYSPLIVMNTILGGSFTSRLNQNLRETHGYTYGAFSAFDFRPAAGPFIASAAVQTDVTDKALSEFMKEIKGITDSVSAQEVTRAKNYLALQFPSEFQSVSSIATRLGDVVAYGLPDDYFNTYVRRVMQVTRAEVERVAKKYIDPQRIAIIVVGDRSKVEPGVRALKLGELRTLTVDDVLGKALALP